MSDAPGILVLNAGSSSLKFALFGDPPTPGAMPVRRCGGQIDGIGTSAARFQARDAAGQTLAERALGGLDHEAALQHLLGWLLREAAYAEPAVAGHRVVHGGTRYRQPVRVDAGVLATLRDFIPLAPLHMPHNLAAIETLRKRHPHMRQVACFDTAFHHSMPPVERYYALPRVWFDRGIRRYGFHGLSYEYIARALGENPQTAGYERVVVAHLGQGASLCALHRGQSVATTMGFTPLDGVPMATRPGQLDPGVVTYLVREAGLSVADVDDMLNHHSGLAGLSGGDGDMRALLADERPEARAAVDYFVHHVHRAIGSLAAALGGLDALVFTGGIGEHSAIVRQRICAAAAWLGIVLDEAANARGEKRISRPTSAVAVWRIPTDEEAMIACHCRRLLDDSQGGTS